MQVRDHRQSEKGKSAIAVFVPALQKGEYGE